MGHATEGHVVNGSHLWRELGLLGHVGDELGEVTTRQGSRRSSLDADDAFEVDQPGEGLQQRGLAGAVRTNETEPASALEGEVDTVERGRFDVAHDKVAQLDDRWRQVDLSRDHR